MGNISSLFPEEMNLVCDCTHEESDHIFAGGCKLCNCTCYSQLKQRVRGYKLTLPERVELLKSIGVVVQIDTPESNIVRSNL